MTRATSLWQVAIGLALGGAAVRGPFAAVPMVGFALLAVFALLALRRWRRYFVVAIALGAALSARELRQAEVGWREPTMLNDRVVDDVAGVITGPVTRTDSGYGARLTTELGSIWLWSPTEIAPGDVVLAQGRLRSPARMRNPGSFDRVARARVRGVVAELSAREVEIVGRQSAWPWRWADGVRASWRNIIGDAPGAALVRGAVVGDRAGISEQTNQDWRAAGVFHALSVSGLHLAVIALLLFSALRFVIAASSLGRSGRAARYAAPLSVIAAVGYTLVTGAEVATQRALVVVLIMLAGQALGRPPRLLDALGAAAIFILVSTPSALVDPSFQLSFTAATLFALLPHAKPHGGRARRLIGKVFRAVLSSAWVTAATAPITALTFQQVAWGGVLGNLVVTPILELLVIPLTLLSLLIEPLFPSVTRLGIDTSIALTRFADGVAGQLATVTPTRTVITPTLLEVALYVAALASLLAAYRGDLRPRRGIGLAAIALVLLIGARTWRDHARANTTTLTATFVDVGQGDAIIVEVPGGEVWLIDAGGAPGAPTREAMIAPGVEVARVLRQLGHDHVDLAIVSHPHPDHYLGLLAVADAMPIIEVWSALETEAPEAPTNTLSHPDSRPIFSFTDVLISLRARGTKLVTPPIGLARSNSGATLEVLWPHTIDGNDVIATADPVRNVNDNSLVVRVSYAKRRILFLGDIEAEAEDSLSSLPDLRAEVVKVAHHGSATSSTTGLITAVDALVAVVSVGAGNRFGLPRADALERWSDAHVQVLRTDEVGAVTVVIEPSGTLTVNTVVPTPR